MSERRYWPFEVLPPDRQTPVHKSEIRFLEAAYSEGFRPYFEGLECSATSENGREGCIYRRGGRRWWGEIFLSDPGGENGRAFVDNFDCAANAVLCWLRGDNLSDILADIPDRQTPLPRRDVRCATKPPM
jgi:hypothetical protein